ncbi:hypothetical protein [Aeromonas veronii]
MQKLAHYVDEITEKVSFASECDDIAQLIAPMCVERELAEGNCLINKK